MTTESLAADLTQAEMATDRLQSRQNAILRFVRRKPMGALSASIIGIMVVVALLAPLLAPHDPFKVHRELRLLPPSLAHWMGTDEFGRDAASRLIYGARLSLGVGLSAVVVSVTLGAAIGILSAYWGGPVETVLQRLMDILMAFPSLLLALVLVAVAGASVLNVILAIGITQLPSISRVIRSAALVVKQSQFMEAAQASGAGHSRIILRHVLPNVVAPIIIYASINIGFAILTEASLSFLGLGVPPPAPSWGGMLTASSEAYLQQSPWLAIFPGLAISLAVLSFNTLGDALRDILDPRLRGGR